MSDPTVDPIRAAIDTKTTNPSVPRQALTAVVDELARLRQQVASLTAKLGQVHDTDEVLVHFQSYAPRIQRAIASSSRCLDGYPTGGDATGDGTSRTEALGIAHAFGREKEDGTMSGPRDPHGAQRHAVERWVEEGSRLVNQLAPSNKAAEHLATQASDVCPTGCCESCWRDHGYRTPARTAGSRLCKWCSDWANELGVDMPYMSLVRLRHQGKTRITQRDVDIARRNKA